MNKITRFLSSGMTFLTTSLLVLLLSISSAQAANESAGDQAVEHIANLFTRWSGEDDPAVFKDAASVIDYHEMSQRALGPYWSTLKPAEQAEFKTQFQHLVEERYYKRWHRLFQKGKLSILQTEKSQGDLIVKSSLSNARKEEMLVWRLSNKNGNCRVVSLDVGGEDLLNRISGRFQKRFAKGGFKGMLAWMKNEADD